MATKNVVPRANGEGELGTSSKQWKKVNAQQFTGSLGVSASFFEGDGSRLTNVGGGSSFSVTGDVNNRVITADGSSGGVGEANLTFDGSSLLVTGDARVTSNLTASAIYITAEGAPAIVDSNGNQKVQFDAGEINFYGDTQGSNATMQVVNNKIEINPNGDNVDFRVGGGSYKFLVDHSESRVEVIGDLTASVNVSASAFYGEKVFADELYETGGNREASLSPGVFTTFNNFVAGKNASPDVFAVDRTARKAAVGVDIGDVSSLSSDFTVVGDVSASVNVSASAFYGKQLVQQHPGGTTYPILSEGTATGEKQPYFDISLAYNTSMNRLYVGTIQTNTSGYYIADSNASHPTEISGKALMYAIGGEMYVKDESGNQTLISPHDEDGEWQYYSRNTRTGKVVRIRMEKMIRALEELTGQTFIEEE